MGSATKFDGSRNCGSNSNPARSLAQFELVHLSEFVKSGPSKLIGFVPYCTGIWRAQPFCGIRLEACRLEAHESKFKELAITMSEHMLVTAQQIVQSHLGSICCPVSFPGFSKQVSQKQHFQSCETHQLSNV